MALLCPRLLMVVVLVVKMEMLELVRQAVALTVGGSWMGGIGHCSRVEYESWHGGDGGPMEVSLVQGTWGRPRSALDLLVPRYESGSGAQVKLLQWGTKSKCPEL